MSAAPVVARAGECEEIDRFLGALAGGCRCLLLEGEVGIGKTTLLTWARTAAAERGHQVLSASPVEAEVPWDFSALADLLHEIPEAALASLPGPQRNALEVAVFRDRPADSAVDPRTLATAVLRTLTELADHAPVLLAVDDLPWLDLPTARVLSYVLRRSASTPLGLLGAVRLDWSRDQLPLVTDTIDPDRVERVTVGPVSFREMGALLAERDHADLGRATLAEVYELSRGNPFFAVQLAGEAAMADPGAPTTPPPERSLGVPDSLGNLVRRRFKPLSSGARDLLLLAALSAEPSEAAVLAATSRPDTANDDLAQLEEGGIVRRRGDDLAFTHPLIRSVAIAGATVTQRLAAHRRLAQSVGHPEARARHLALGAEGPDEMVAAEVESAAAAAASRGAGETAALLAALSVSLTPRPMRAERHRRMAAEAEARFEASEPAQACALLEAVVDEMAPGPERAELLRRLARYSLYRGEGSGQTARLTAALEEAGDDTALRATIALDLATSVSNAGRLADAADYSANALALAEQCGDEALAAQVCAGWAFDNFRRGEGVDRDLVARGLSGPEQPPRLSMELRPGATLAHLLHLSDDLDGARTLYEREYERASEEGLETGLPMLLWGLVETEAWAGNWDRAEELCAEGIELADESASLAAISLMVGVRGLLHALRGRTAEAEEDGSRCIAQAFKIRFPGAVARGAQALGVAGLSIGDARGVHRHLGPICEFVAAGGMAEPGLLHFVPDEIEALVRLGELELADELLTLFEARAADRGRLWGIATSARCRGLWLAAGGDTTAAQAAIDRALQHHDALGMPFEQGRTLLVAAEIRRRARHRRQAQDDLEAAAAIFAKLGAPLWERRAHDDLERLGLRPAARSAPGTDLTATERQVADLVVSGLTNAQVAGQLFMAQRTVEAHLQRVFRKLGVQSRTQLSRAYPPPPS